MNIEKKKLNTLRPNTKNTRIHPPVQIQELSKSIKKFGQIRPIIIDDTSTILCGHALFLALQSLNHKEADVLILSNLTEKEKKKLLIADNRIQSLGTDNYNAIIDILKDIGDFEVPGFDEDYLNFILNENETVPLEIDKTPAVPTLEYTPTEDVFVPLDSTNKAENTLQQKAEDIQNTTKEKTTIRCPYCKNIIDID